MVVKMAAMKTPKPIQIFKAGKHTAMSGAALSFSETDLAATAAAYDPAKHEAPLVVGHPKTDDPAYGWVGKLSFSDGALSVDPVQVNVDFAELVNSGSFKKISASFYSPDSPSNPVPGVYYLRHVGFLGAQPPAVKGLRNPSFADAEQGVVEFGDYDDRVNASLWRRMRDWFIGEQGLDVADKIIPDWDINTLEEYARREEPKSDLTNGAGLPAQFSEKGTDVTPEQKAALEAENAQLKKQLADASARDKAAKKVELNAQHAAFAETLIKAGKLLPAQKGVAVATLDFMASQEIVVEFGEGDAKKPVIDAFKEFLGSLPKQVEFAEVGADKGTAKTVDFAAPAGYSVESARLETHQKALQYQEQNKCDYITAVKMVDKT